MHEALKALNRLVADEVIKDYAIGGAIGAAFYIKAAQTEDVHAFVFLPADTSGLVTLTPIYEALIALGGIAEGAHLRFGEWPVQILSDTNSLMPKRFCRHLSSIPMARRLRFSVPNTCARSLCRRAAARIIFE